MGTLPLGYFGDTSLNSRLLSSAQVLCCLTAVLDAALAPVERRNRLPRRSANLNRPRFLLSLETAPTVGVAELAPGPTAAVLRNMMRPPSCNQSRNATRAVRASEHRQLPNREKGSVPEIPRNSPRRASTPVFRIPLTTSTEKSRDTIRNSASDDDNWGQRPFWSALPSREPPTRRPRTAHSRQPAAHGQGFNGLFMPSPALESPRSSLSKSCIPMTRSEAEAKGYAPCARCRPRCPETELREAEFPEIPKSPWLITPCHDKRRSYQLLVKEPDSLHSL